MNYLMAVQLKPKHPQQSKNGDLIDSSIDIIEQSGLTHFVGPMETTVEGTLDELMNLVKKLNSHLEDGGVSESETSIKLVQSNDSLEIRNILSDYYEFDEEE
ncbi:thiamine-binding protein [Salinicoccus albus]|uniref:thiamine-binding protein n=1 Tax=Salinicoccus albus TaxID=418756 RepID=UPI00037CA979|nr:thiamine-binding protein [Salinicoccus albus]